MTDNWDNLFNGTVQGILPRPVSDHFPVLLEGGGFQRQDEDVVGEFKIYRDI